MSLIYSQPIGSFGDALFTPADLQQIATQFADSTATYFGNPEDTVICVNVPWQSGDQQCSTKAELWIVPQYVPVPYTPPVVPPTCTTCVPPPTPPVTPSVPEPQFVGLLLLLVVLLAIALKVRSV